MDIKTGIKQLTQRHNLSRAEIGKIIHSIMNGECTPAQISGFLIALRMKGESVDEIIGAAQVMRQLSTPVEVRGEHLVDVVGTGGDGANTFNISTASSFVAAAAGAKVAKHGNRSVSSQSGSADVLEAAGVNLKLTPTQVAHCIDEIGIGFMFAPLHHSAMKHAVEPRRDIGIRTIFNLLGPLTNPAGAKKQLLGVFSREWLEPLAHVLHQLGSEHVLVVYAEDGMDEISITANTFVAELRHDRIETYTLTPQQFGFSHAPMESLTVKNPIESLERVCAVLNDQPGAGRDIVVLNAGAALYAADVVNSLEEGMTQADEAIRSGKARDKLEALIKLSNSFSA
jgi:anthranilate phosphoribosyltransferase